MDGQDKQDFSDWGFLVIPAQAGMTRKETT